MTFYIYVVGPVTGFPCKVGVASNIRKRLKALQTACPEELHVHRVYAAANRATAFKVEKFVHRQLEENRMQGEWFNVFAEDAVAVLQDVCERMGYGNRANILKSATENLTW